MHESEALKDRLERALAADEDLGPRVTLCDYTCFGRCDDGPNMFVRELADGDDEHEEPDPEVLEEQRGLYPGMDPEKIVRVMKTHCTTGDPVEELVDNY